MGDEARALEEKKQTKREDRLREKQWRSEDALLRNARQKQLDAEDRAWNNELRHAANSMQQEFQSNPVLKKVKLDADRQDRLTAGGQSTLKSSSSLPTLQLMHKTGSAAGNYVKGGDQALQKARRLNAKVMAEFN